MKRLLFFLQIACAICSFLVAARPAARWGKRQIHRAQARRVWEETLEQEASPRVSGDPVYWLGIPDAGIDTLVLQSDTRENLNRHPCLATRSPDVITGHRDTHFKHLHRLKVGDDIHLETPQGLRHHFRVTEIEILPSVQVPSRIRDHRNPSSLALLTCYPFRYVGAAPDRYLVWAEKRSVDIVPREHCPSLPKMSG